MPLSIRVDYSKNVLEKVYQTNFFKTQHVLLLSLLLLLLLLPILGKSYQKAIPRHAGKNGK